MKSIRKSWFGWVALTLTVASGVHAQAPEFDPQTGSARISGGDAYADYRSEPADAASFEGHAGYQPIAPYSAYPPYGGGYLPPAGVQLDPAFRAAAGLGGPSLSELDRIRFSLLHADGDIAGVDEGFTNVGAFLPLRVFSDYNLFAFNPRLLIDNSGNAGFNLGAIHRFYVPDLDRMFGNSFWWDFSRSYGDEIQGFGYSFETVGRYMSFRFNANVNVGESQKIYAQQVFAPQLGGNNIVLPVLEFFEAPLDNYTAEVAVPAPVLGKYGLELAAGGYVLTGSGVEDTIGVRARAQWQVTEDLWVNTVVTNDDLFDTNVSVNFELTLPNGMPSRIARPNPVVMSLVQSVQRNYQAKVARGQRTKFFTEIDPNDNLPIQVALIDPNLGAGGNGSVDSPYGSVAQYMAEDPATRAAYDIILVNARNDNTDVNLNTGITLTDCQHLFGNGTNPSGIIPTYTSTRGTFFLPGIVAGDRPRLSNRLTPGGNVVTLAGNATEVANFLIVGSNNGSGIVSTGAIDGFNIHDNTIANVVDAIRITSNTAVDVNCPGQDFGIVERNIFQGISGTANLATSITHTGGQLNLLVADNTMDPFDNAGIEVIATGPNSVVNAVGAGVLPELGILRNDLDEMGTGIRLSADSGADILVDLQDNVVTNSSDANGAGLQVTATDPGSTVVLNTFEDNEFSDGEGHGASLSASGGASILAPGVIQRNIFSGNDLDGMHIEAAGAGSAVIFQAIGDGTVVNSNTFDGNVDDGLDVFVNAGAQFTVADPITGNFFSNNLDDGFNALAMGPGSLLNFHLGSFTTGLGNVFNDNGAGTASGEGAAIRVTNGAVFTGGIFNNTFTGNAGDGVSYSLVNTSQGPLIIRGNTARSNGGMGLNITAINTPFQDIDVINNLFEGSTGGDGMLFAATASPVNGDFRIIGNGFRRNAGNGINIDLDGSPIENLQILANQGGEVVAAGNVSFTYTSDSVPLFLFQPLFNHTMTNNSTAGIDIIDVSVDLAGSGQIWRPDIPILGGGTPFQPLNQTDVFTGLDSVNGNLITAGTTPLQDRNGNVLANGGVPIASQLLDLVFNDFNPGENFEFELLHSTQNSLLFPSSGDTMAGSVVSITLADGTVLSGVMAVDATPFDTSSVTINQAVAGTQQGISSNGGTGIRIDAENGSHIDQLAIQGNNIDNNGQHGIEIIALDSRLPGNANPLMIQNNTITNQVTGDGFRMLDVDTNGSQVNVQLHSNTISSNGGRGVNVSFAENTPARFVARNNLISNNGDVGLNVGASDNAVLDVVIGTANVGATNNGNLIDGNTNAGVGITGEDDAVVRLSMTNTVIQNTIDGTTLGARFNGDGLGISMLDRSIFSGSVTASQFLNNEGAGISFGASGNNLADFSQILFFDIGGPLDEDANLFQGNAFGIRSIRTSNGLVGSQRAVDIRNNVITDNLLDGIFLSSQQAFVTDFYLIRDNIVSQNSANGFVNFNAGIHLDVEADAQMVVDIFDNIVTNNFADGILTTEDVNFPSDQRAVQGFWQNNTITNNLGNGINLTGATNNLFIGDEVDDTLGNLISGNGLDGVNNVAGGTWSLANNLIQLNGIHGVDIGGVGFKDVRIVHNHITRNGFEDNAIDGPGDGIEFQNNFQAMLLTVLGNTIDFNEGRGVDILNQNDAFSQIIIATDLNSGVGNVINANGGEGIYVVNTSSQNQNQSDTTPEDPFANGADQPVGATHKGMNTDATDISDTAFLDITIDNTLVVANGQDNAVTDFQATGVVFRIGTTGGDYGFTDPGGFASDIFRGGVVASLTNNTWGGNFGDDLFFESFTSTVDPGTTTGTWNQNEFDPDNYHGDPLARLDLTYRNNTFLEDPLLIAPPALVTAQGAYYDNAEGTFKSRLSNIQAPNIAGPFANAARRRNAQRQALRVYGDGTVLPPVVGPGLTFLYPGVGDSTFRINLADSDPIATLQQIGFFFDATSPLFTQFDANGVFYPIGGNTQDFRGPWGWGTF